MAALNLPEKNISDSNVGDDHNIDQGIASPVDCWELVGSRPGSPLPEARGDIQSLENVIASACNSGSLLQDNYFGCTHSPSDDAVLPVSTGAPDKQNDDDCGSSESSDALVSLASDTDAMGALCDGEHTDNADLTGDGGDGMHYDDHMYHNDTYHDDLPYYDQVQHGHHRKVHDEFMMHHNELMEHDDSWHIEDETHFDSIVHTDEDSARCTNQSGHSCEIVESTAAPNVHHEVCAFGLSSGLESHGMDNIDMSMPQVLDEGDSSTVLLEEDGMEITSQVSQARDSVRGTADIPNKRQHKSFVCVSWIWTQLIRWQTQLGHANTIWSVALAAAVMGILILGRGWQRLQAQNQSLRSQLWAKEKRITQLMFQLMQTKDALAKVRRVPVICVKPSLQIPQDNF